jgi:hypothetical protein
MWKCVLTSTRGATVILPGRRWEDMKRKAVNKRITLPSLTIMILLTLFSFALVNCAASGSRGTLQSDMELNRMILAYKVLPDHNYYHSGSFDRPNAILGIHKDYHLVSQLWKPVQVGSAQLAKWIQSIGPEKYKGQTGYVAAYILNPEGRKVGLWYSIMKNTEVEFLEGNKIKVNSPDLYPPSKLEAPSGINIGS